MASFFEKIDFLFFYANIDILSCKCYNFNRPDWEVRIENIPATSDVRKPLTTYALLSKFFREGVERQKLLLLGAVLQFGVKRSLEHLQKTETDATLDFIRKIAGELPEDTVFQNEGIRIALQFALLRLFEESGTDLRIRFQGELTQIFSEDFAARLAELGIELALVYKKEDPDGTLFNERVEKYIAERDNFIKEVAALPTTTAPHKTRHSSTPSKIVPCPRCGFEKRCFPDMKKFRCKNPARCDFESTFHFNLQNPLAES